MSLGVSGGLRRTLEESSEPRGIRAPNAPAARNCVWASGGAWRWFAGGGQYAAGWRAPDSAYGRSARAPSQTASMALAGM